MSNTIKIFDGTELKFVPKSEVEREMANGSRCQIKTPLTDDEIEFIKTEILRIEANLDVFIFNDEKHTYIGTCYNFNDDKVFVSRNVFPDNKYGSIHPRDIERMNMVNIYSWMAL